VPNDPPRGTTAAVGVNWVTNPLFQPQMTRPAADPAAGRLALPPAPALVPLPVPGREGPPGPPLPLVEPRASQLPEDLDGAPPAVPPTSGVPQPGPLGPWARRVHRPHGMLGRTADLPDAVRKAPDFLGTSPAQPQWFAQPSERLSNLGGNAPLPIAVPAAALRVTLVLDVAAAVDSAYADVHPSPQLRARLITLVGEAAFQHVHALAPVGGVYVQPAADKTPAGAIVLVPLASVPPGVMPSITVALDCGRRVMVGVARQAHLCAPYSATVEFHNLAPGTAQQGLTSAILECAGYRVTTDAADPSAVYVAAEMAGVHRAKQGVVRFSGCPNAGHVVAFIRPPAGDPGLRKLPRECQSAPWSRGVPGDVLTHTVRIRVHSLDAQERPPSVSPPAPALRAAAALNVAGVESTVTAGHLGDSSLPALGAHTAAQGSLGPYPAAPGGADQSSWWRSRPAAASPAIFASYAALPVDMDTSEACAPAPPAPAVLLPVTSAELGCLRAAQQASMWLSRRRLRAPHIHMAVAYYDELREYLRTSAHPLAQHELGVRAVIQLCARKYPVLPSAEDPDVDVRAWVRAFCKDLFEAYRPLLPCVVPAPSTPALEAQPPVLFFFFGSLPYMVERE
jgi:hypothetical protein